MADIYSNYDRIERTFEKLKESDLSEQNKECLKEFAEFLMADNLSDHKIYRYIQSFRVLSHEIDFKLEDPEKKDLIRLIGKINQNNVKGKDYSAESRKELKKSIKKFYKWIDDSESPEIVSFMSLNIKKSNKSKVDPNELPTAKQVRNLVETANNPRDKAMFYVLWESGARVGELLNLDWSNVKKSDDFYRIDLDGKTGGRTVPISESRDLLDKWQNYQYERYNPVFTSLQAEKRISYRSIYNQLKRNAEKAGIDCKVNPHAFRKSRATYLASEGANVFQLMEFFGWSQAETAKTYVRLAQSDVDALVKSVSRDVHI